MNATKRIAALLTAASVIGCQGDRLAGPERAVVGAVPTAGPASILTTASTQSVSGNVTLSAQPDPSQPGVVFTYSFSANQKLEALALTPSFIQGQFHFEFKFANVQEVVDGSVACFFVVGNKVRLAGVIDRTNDPILFPVGSTMIWSVTDGDGILLPVTLPAAAPAKVPDTASPLLRLPGVDPLTFCLAGGFLPELPVLRGQVQVKAN